jgi:hypothetical protein
MGLIKVISSVYLALSWGVLFTSVHISTNEGSSALQVANLKKYCYKSIVYIKLQLVLNSTLQKLKDTRELACYF